MGETAAPFRLDRNRPSAQTALVATNFSPERWLSDVDILIIKRELELDRIIALADMQKDQRVRGSRLQISRKRIEHALKRLNSTRQDLLAKL